MRKHTRLGLLWALLCAFTYAQSTYYTVLEASWNLINLQKAYDENPDITGQGVTVGIVDGVFNTAHPSLNGKDLGVFNNQADFSSSLSQSNYGDYQHGTHVSGIILGSKQNDGDPHGIAYEGKYYGVALLNRYLYQGSLQTDLGNKGIKIINNSWGKAEEWHPLINRYTDFGYGYTSINGDYTSTESITGEQYFELVLSRSGGNRRDNNVYDLINLTKEEGILNIVASGNDSSLSSGVLGAAAAFDESLRAWVVVGALDAQYIETDSASGKLKIDSGADGWDREYAGVAYFSNLFKGTSLYGITAPGVDIDSANALYGNKNLTDDTGDKMFVQKSGTSQATPMVTGAAMLVAQKFSFLSGAQIADVLLSTANDDVIMPKIIVQNFNNGGFYNIIYVDTDVPMKDGKIDREQVKQDLMDLDYTDTTADEILSKLFKTQDAVNANNVKDSEAIVRLSKHEVIGQGILDVQKALKGIGELDANRMSAENVATFQGETQAFYTIDTQGISATFGNDITQRTWDNKWHLDSALNSPREALKDISKIGLLKSGAGRLTLSGNSSYAGATRVIGGELELSSSGSLTQSSVYAESGGTFILSGGTISTSGNAINGGILQITESSSMTNATAQHGGLITLGTSEKRDATLTSQTITLSNVGIMQGVGTITNNGTGGNNGTNGNATIDNKSGILRAGFFAGSVLETASQNTLTLQGTYKQESNATLQLAFNGEDLGNSKLVATNYDIQGGTLQFVPTYKSGDSRLKSGQSIKLDLGTLNNYTSNFHSINAESSNTLAFMYDNTSQTLTSGFKDNAFIASNGDSSAAGVLKEISQLDSINSVYEDFFGNLDVADSAIYQAGVDSLVENATLSAMEDNLSLNTQLSLNNIMFVTDTHTHFDAPFSYAGFSNGVKNARFSKRASGQTAKKSPLKLAAVNLQSSGIYSDMPNSNDIILRDVLKKLDSVRKNQFALNTNYTYFNRKSHKANNIGTNLQYRRIFSESFLLGGYVDFANTTSNATYATLKSNRFSAGLSGIYDFSALSILGSASVGMGMHNLNRSVIGVDSRSSGAYNDYLFSLSLGVAKDFWLKSVQFKPMALLTHTSVIQDGFSESGSLFAKDYQGNVFNTLGASVGLNVGYVRDFSKWSLLVGGFGFYNVRFGSEVSQNVAFSDFANFAFRQDFAFSAHSFYGGLNAQARYNRYFGRLGLGSEVGEGYYYISTNLTLGVEF